MWTAVLATSLLVTPVGTLKAGWRRLAPGIAYRALKLVQHPEHGDGRLHVVRLEPSRAQLVVRSASALDRKNRTAAQWADDFEDIAVINAGMYETDYSTHTGYLRLGSHINSKVWTPQYKSVFFLREDGRAHIEDIDQQPANLARYAAVVQNLRLIKAPGRNVWAESSRQWSEAALAMDKEGRILFLFTRTPFPMRRLNRILLMSSLGITRAHHLEGGPEASLSIRSKGIRLDLCGSYETGFNEGDDNASQWALPNVIAVRVR